MKMKIWLRKAEYENLGVGEGKLAKKRYCRKPVIEVVKKRLTVSIKGYIHCCENEP